MRSSRTTPCRWLPRARRIALALGLVAAAACRQAPAPAGPYAGPVQHVILLSLDTTRADHLGCYGNPWIRTPRLDALAAESIQFLDYMTVATTTLPSHVSLFTGKYPHSHGVPRNGFVANPANVMLAEILERAGFRTAGFLGSFALDSRFGCSRGFQYYDETYSTRMGVGGADQDQRRAGEVTDAVIRYLDRTEPPRNLFLFVHYFDPHLPYSPPPPYDSTYRTTAEPGRVRMTGHPALQGELPSPKARANLALYAGEVSYMDEQIGRLLDDLKRRGILDRSILVVTSDHGENLGDAPGPPFDHGWTVYGVEERAVCLVRLPGALHGGTKSATLVASVDVLPTLLRYLGLPPPAGIDGEALDILSPPTAPDGRIRFAEATKPWKDVEAGAPWFNQRKARCARTEALKYVSIAYRGIEELYDLRDDPRERRNLLAGSALRPGAPGNDLRAALEAWDARGRPLPTEFEPNQSEETLRRLRSLGYLGGGAGEGDR